MCKMIKQYILDWKSDEVWHGIIMPYNPNGDGKVCWQVRWLTLLCDQWTGQRGDSWVKSGLFLCPHLTSPFSSPCLHRDFTTRSLAGITHPDVRKIEKKPKKTPKSTNKKPAQFFPLRKNGLPAVIYSTKQMSPRFISIHWLEKSFTGFWQSPWKVLHQSFSDITSEWQICLRPSPPSQDVQAFWGGLFIWNPLLSFQFSVLGSNHFWVVLRLRERIVLVMMQWILNKQRPKQIRPLQSVPRAQLHEWGRFHSALQWWFVAWKVCCRIASKMWDCTLAEE